MDLALGGNVVAKNVTPKWTVWNPKTVSAEIKRHKKASRRAYKQYLKSGDVRDFNRSQRKITNFDFD